MDGEKKEVEETGGEEDGGHGGRREGGKRETRRIQDALWRRKGRREIR